MEDWRRKELKRQSNTRPYSPIARPRRIQARMKGRCRGPRPQFAPGEEVFARARIFRPGEITPVSSMNFRSRRGTVAQAKSHSSWTRNAFIGGKRGRKGDLKIWRSKEKSIEVTKSERELTVSQAIFRCWVLMAAMGS